MTNQNLKLTKTYFLYIVIFVSVFSVSYFILANSKDDIVYPVAELQNCKNEQECRSYCDQPQNVAVCLNFAKKHNLLSTDEIQKAEKFLVIGGKGPGGCASHSECENYCSNIDNINECIDFAEKHGMMQEEELQEAKKIQQALARGVKMPGGCRSREECENYCSNPSNMEQCLIFAETAGFMAPEELAEAKKVMAAVKRGVKPPPCMGRSGREACESYCRLPENFKVCITFAKEAGLMSDREVKDAEKMLTALEKGVKPPPCANEQECNVYCSKEAHIQECIAFAEAAGFMSAEEAEMARKTGGKGPGGCKGEQECRAFCENPANQEICFNFAKEHDLISDEDKMRIKEGVAEMQKGLESAPPQVRECLERELGSQKISEIRSGTAVVGPHIGDIMRRCFEQFMPKPEETMEHPEGLRPPEEFGAPQGIPSGFTGPGGCTNPEECMKYCQEHPQECGQFKAPEQTQQQHDQQYEQQYQQQYEREYQRQFEEQYQPQSQEGPSGFFLQQIKQAAASLLNNFLKLFQK